MSTAMAEEASQSGSAPDDTVVAALRAYRGGSERAEIIRAIKEEFLLTEDAAKEIVSGVENTVRARERGFVDYLAELPAKGRRKAGERIGKAAKVTAAIKHPEEAAAESRGLKFATGLGAIARGEYDAPREIVPRLVLEKRVHWLAGHPGHGKTTLAMYVAVEHMHAGGHVIWLDWEAGKVPTVERLLATGATVEQVDDEDPAHQFHLVVGSPLQADEDGFAPIAAALEVYPGALVVFDSASKALSAAGLDENSAPDATKWTTNIVIPTREAGATVIVIDHVVKGATKSTPYARGAGSKLADTDVAWYVEAVVAFDRETSGRVEVTRKKDREGLLPERLAFEVGDGAGKLPVTAVEVEDEGSRSKREEGMRSRVLMTLQEHSAPDRPLSASQVVKLTRGKESALREALRELAADPSAPVKSEPAGQSVHYFHDPDAVTSLGLGND